MFEVISQKLQQGLSKTFMGTKNTLTITTKFQAITLV
jgi:hypothetical protein